MRVVKTKTPERQSGKSYARSTSFTVPDITERG